MKHRLQQTGDLARAFPRGVHWKPAIDSTLAIRASLYEVEKTLAEAILLVVLVIFFFLHGWRSLVITAVTLPVSLIGTFSFVRAFGFSINTLTLFGLTLATERGHLFRAVLEGIAFGFRHHLDVFAELGQVPRRVRVMGGACARHHAAASLDAAG